MKQLIHYFDLSTHAYLGSEDAKRDQFDECWIVPSNATLISPIIGDTGSVNIFDEVNQSWSLVPDFRGQEFYQKENGEKVVIEKVGEVPNSLTDKPRPNIWSVFDEKKNAWATDKVKEAEYLAALKVSKQQEAAAFAQLYIDTVTNDYAPTFERESYTLQAAEAAMWSKDKLAKTPILDGIAKTRGVDPDSLKAKALGKSQQYQALCAAVTGQRQALEDQINIAKNIEELEAIQPELVFKVES